MSSFFIEICNNNYKPHESLKDFHIGFNKLEIITYIFPTLALTLNIISVINYFRERNKSKYFYLIKNTYKK